MLLNMIQSWNILIRISSCVLKALLLFLKHDQRDKEALVRQHTLTIIKKGRFLFKQGEKPRGLICLASGKAKVYKEGVGGRDQILKMVRQQGSLAIRHYFLIFHGQYPPSHLKIAQFGV